MAPRSVATSCETLAEEPPGVLSAVGSGGPASPLLRSFCLFWKTDQGMCSPQPFPPPPKLHSEMGRQLHATLGGAAEISRRSPSSYTAERIDSPGSGAEVESGQPADCVLFRLQSIFEISSQHPTFGRIRVKLQKLWQHQASLPRWRRLPGNGETSLVCRRPHWPTSVTREPWSSHPPGATELVNSCMWLTLRFSGCPWRVLPTASQKLSKWDSYFLSGLTLL